MAYVNNVSTQTNVYTYDELQQLIANGAIDKNSIKNISVFAQSSDPSKCTDGNDDGKIGFFEASKSVAKGAGKGLLNGVKGMFFNDNGKFSLGKTLKTAATVGACFIPGVGPVVAAGLCAFGAVKGVAGVANGVVNAAGASTDADKKAAFESIGGNTLSTALSVAGLKTSAGAIAKNAGKASLTEGAKGIGAKVGNAVKNTTESVKTYYNSAWKTTGKNLFNNQKIAKDLSETGASFNEAALEKLNFGDKMKVGAEIVKTAGKDTASNIINAGKTVGNKFKKEGEGASHKLIKSDSSAKTLKLEQLKSSVSEKIPSTLSKKYSNAADFIKNVNGYEGLFENGNIMRAGLATAANRVSDEGAKLNNAIYDASTLYAAVDTQTGYAYNLEDYTLTE